MARLRRKRREASSIPRVEAFKLFATLDYKLDRKYTFIQISEMLSIPVATLYTWNMKYKWKKVLKRALERASARAMNKKQLRKMLTTYLIEEENLLDKRNEESAAKEEEIQKKKKERLVKALKNTPDVIYEMRAYNHKMFRILMAEPKEGGRGLTAREREVYHRAWKDSLDSLMETLGVGSIRELASSMASIALPADELPPNVNININNGQQLPIETPVVLGESTHKLIMSTLLGELPIDGPTNYTGHKEFSGEERIEEAVITK